MAAPRNLRYSPLNWLIVDWSDSAGTPFNDCGLPEPAECLDSGASCSDSTTEQGLAIAEAINTYDWARWLPEVIVGIDDPDEEIAANYVRQAAIDFCTGGRVLQREVRIDLQAGVDVYPVFPYIGEQIVGVIGIRSPDFPVVCHGGCLGTIGGMTWRLDTARNELHIVRDRFWPKQSCSGVLRLLVWSSPTEDACVHDVFLYDNFRKDITQGARNAYVRAVHFRDKALMNSLLPDSTFEKAIILAKTKAVNLPSAWKDETGSGAFGGRNCLTREEYYRMRS